MNNPSNFCESDSDSDVRYGDHVACDKAVKEVEKCGPKKCALAIWIKIVVIAKSESVRESVYHVSESERVVLKY